MGWPLGLTTVGMGLAVIAYTVSGGTVAVGQTQKQQMIVMLAGVAIAAVLSVLRLPEDVSLPSAIKLAGALDRLRAGRRPFDEDAGRQVVCHGSAGVGPATHP